MSSDPHQELAWSQPTRYLVGTLLVLTAVAFVIYARDLVASLTIATLITSILTPLVHIFQNRLRLSRRLAGGIVYIIFLAIVLTIPALFAPYLIDQAQALIGELQTLAIDLQSALVEDPIVFGVRVPAAAFFESFRGNTLSYFVPSDLINIFNSISENLIWVLVTLVVIFYLLQDWENLREWALKQAPSGRRDETRRLYEEIKGVWQAYLRGQLVLMGVIGIVSWLGATAIGLRSAWAIGLLAGILDVIPSLGPAIAALVGLIIAWLTGSTYLPVSNFVFTIIVLILFTVIQTIENVWWRPKIMGNSLKIHPGLVFLGVAGSLALSGVFLTLIIVPLLGSVGVLGRYTRAKMLGLDPWSKTTEQ